MSTGIEGVPADATLVEAGRRMQVSGVGGLPLLDPRAGGCAGILTERDIVIRVLAEGRDPRAMLVRDVATLDPVTCAPDEELETALARMQEHKVQHLPVVDGERVVGLLSLADVVFGQSDAERRSMGPPFTAGQGGSQPPPTERAAAEEQTAIDSIENPAPPGDDAPTG